MSAISSHSTQEPGGYLSRASIMMALIVGLVPNIFFLLIAPAYIVYRSFTPFLYLGIGFLSYRLPKPAVYLACFIVAILELLIIVAVAFHLGLKETITSIEYIFTLNIWSSLLYVLVVASVIGSALLTAFLLCRFRRKLSSASPMLSMLVVLMVFAINFAGSRAHFTQYEGPIDGALLQNGINAETIANSQRNLLIVMVEGMGAYADPNDKQILQSRLETTVQRGHYSLDSGSTYYNGSTTGAASRELCHRWGDYQDYYGQGEYDCLPRQLAKRGYETMAYHGFSQTMFNRDDWYPRIGFERLHFKEQIQSLPEAGDMKQCGSVFLGLCDDDVGRLVKAELLAPSNRPKMIYWLTLNSHIPFIPPENAALACGTDAAVIDNTLVCHLTAFWDEVFATTVDIANDPNLPPTDILIIGDHHTPIWERAAKSKFTLGKVDWYLLRDQRANPGIKVVSRP